MAQVAKNVQNNFIAGLKTEYTALNFPENAATSCSNMDFSLIGDVSRRGGIDFEANSVEATFTSNVAINSYKWNNVGGDGLTQLVVVQQGGTLTFYKSSATTTSTSLSQQILGSTVNISTFVASGGSFNATIECQFADGNGYLFVFHPSCDPFYCTYNSNAQSITANLITVQIRDFAGLPDNLTDTARPSTLSTEHLYNLFNQGWRSSQTNWSSTSTSSVTVSATPVQKTFIVATGLNVHVNDAVTMLSNQIVGNTFQPVMSGLVVSYASGNGTLVINVTSLVSGGYIGSTLTSWLLTSATQDLIGQFNTAAGAFPSNSDVWWLYKNSSGVFSPSTLLGTITISGPAAQGSIVLNAFNQQRNGLSSGSGTVNGTTDIKTTVRPRTGAWFQGRVWYSGVDANQQATGDAPYTTWTENIYFSQIVIDPTDFGLCYQANDPTSETLFDLLPSDGGVIVIQGSGSVYKLFPVQNGLLVFAANGIWFITGSTGLGFAANDYTVTKISGIQSISGTSFVNVLGWPLFWNLEGIYEVLPGNQAPEGQRVNMSGIQVDNLTVGNILSFYQNIPSISKLYARGTYDPINYQLQWLYRSTPENGIANRYQYDSILVHNTVELPRARLQVPLGKAFYPYSVDTTLGPSVNGIVFVQNPTGSASTPAPIIKYIVSSSKGLTFAEENNFTDYKDWKLFDGVGVDAPAFIITGYNLKPQHHPYYGLWAQALVKHSVSYINVFIRNTSNNSYLFNSIWDWASDPSSGKFSSQQQVTNSLTSNKFQFITKRHRVRGRGYSLQLQFKSQPGLPMDIIGWSIFEHVLEAP